MASVGSLQLGDDGAGEHYSNHFTCIPADAPFRPARVTPKPFVQGPQTALVVGKSGEEIWVDKYGRVKVQFYWDRAGQEGREQLLLDSRLPALGRQELGRDVDSPHRPGSRSSTSSKATPTGPLITGRVYNADQKPSLHAARRPDRQHLQVAAAPRAAAPTITTKSASKTRRAANRSSSTPKKTWTFASRTTRANTLASNRHLIVTTDQVEEVDGDKHEHVKGKHVEAIDGDESLTVNGDQKIQLAVAMSVQVGKTLNEQFGENWVSETVKTIHIKAGMTLVLEAGMQLSLKGPGRIR